MRIPGFQLGRVAWQRWHFCVWHDSSPVCDMTHHLWCTMRHTNRNMWLLTRSQKCDLVCDIIPNMWLDVQICDLMCDIIPNMWYLTQFQICYLVCDIIPNMWLKVLICDLVCDIIPNMWLLTQFQTCYLVCDIIKNLWLNVLICELNNPKYVTVGTIPKMWLGVWHNPKYVT